jgi:hypothetical protein
MSQKTDSDPVVTVVAEELADLSFVEEYGSSAPAKASTSTTFTDSCFTVAEIF